MTTKDLPRTSSRRYAKRLVTVLFKWQHQLGLRAGKMHHLMTSFSDCLLAPREYLTSISTSTNPKPDSSLPSSTPSSPRVLFENHLVWVLQSTQTYRHHRPEHQTLIILSSEADQIQPVPKSCQVYFLSLGSGTFIHPFYFQVLSTPYLPVIVPDTRTEYAGLRNLDFCPRNSRFRLSKLRVFKQMIEPGC